MTVVAADTSVAVALVMASHDQHRAVTNFVGERTVRLPRHAQLETYSVLTRLPGDARVSAADAATLIGQRFGAPIAQHDDVQLEQLSHAGVVGSAVHDAIIGLAAHHAGLTLVTRDARAPPAPKQSAVSRKKSGVGSPPVGHW